ncbi:MAG: hypothetical protein L0338_22215 [Acidobacteria bacterium]|nr:hypothetical protein [Acidobacteriota bacterium]
MILSLGIIVASVILGAYWLRYVSLLIFEAGCGEEHSRSVTNLVQLNYQAVQHTLAAQTASASLDRLSRLIEEDYALLSKLLDGPQVDALERRLLTLNYRLAQLRYRLSRMAGLSQAATALNEMASMMAYCANAAGRSAAR